MSETFNLYQKISLVMKDIQYLQKDDSVSTGKSGSYRALSEEKVTMAVRESLIAHGLVILPVEQEHRREEMRDRDNALKGHLSIVDVKYKIVDIATGQHEILVSTGTGADSQDKGVGKAMTYSYKYMLLRTFAIPTGDDPDKVSSAELDAKHEQEKVAAQEKKAKEDARILTEIKAKWQTIAGDLNAFDEWFNTQVAKGVTHQAINTLLARKLTENKSEEKTHE